MVCLIVAVSSLIYPFVIYSVFDMFLDKLPSAVQGDMADVKKGVIASLLIFQLFYIAGVFFIFIFVSHKIAGPMFKLKKFLKHISDGNAPETLFFRNGDYFREVADYFNEAFQSISDRYKDDSKYIEEVIHYINNLSIVVPEDKKPVLKEIVSRLEQTKDRFDEEL